MPRIARKLSQTHRYWFWYVDGESTAEKHVLCLCRHVEREIEKRNEFNWEGLWMVFILGFNTSKHACYRYYCLFPAHNGMYNIIYFSFFCSPFEEKWNAGLVTFVCLFFFFSCIKTKYSNTDKISFWCVSYQ